MANKYVFAEDIEKEISRLEHSPMVALARKYEQVAHQRKKQMEYLRRLEEKGIALTKAGVTWNKLCAMVGENDFAE